MAKGKNFWYSLKIFNFKVTVEGLSGTNGKKIMFSSLNEDTTPMTYKHTPHTIIIFCIVLLITVHSAAEWRSGSVLGL